MMSLKLTLAALGMLLTVLLGCDGGSDCISQAQTYCENGVNYWVDSCGEFEDQESFCECGCTFDHSGCSACSPNCTEKCCGDDGMGGECPNTCGQDCNLQTCRCETPEVEDTFVYYEDSVFEFVIKDGTSSVETTRMTWTVTDYNSTTKVGTVSMALIPSDTMISLPATFYFKQAGDGGLEYSRGGGKWRALTSPSQAPDVNFLFCVTAAEPSSLLGNVVNGIEAATVSYPGGSSLGYKVYSEYKASGNDSYLYSDYGKEFYAKDTGFSKAVCGTADHSDYPPWTYSREIDMISYKIFWPGGTITEGGEQKPGAPSSLSATYKKNVSTWNSNTGMYEDRTYMSLSWMDNSSNESQFNVYMLATDGSWYSIDRFELVSGATFSPISFPSNTYSGAIKAGYYVNWDPGTYTFRITAASLDLESDPSNEATATAY